MRVPVCKLACICAVRAQCVVFVPAASAAVGGAGSTNKTDTVRALLPSTIPRADAVYNISRTSLLVHALHTSNFELLRIATQDALHQVCHSVPVTFGTSSSKHVGLI